MPCLLAILVLAFPRIAIVAAVLADRLLPRSVRHDPDSVAWIYLHAGDAGGLHVADEIGQPVDAFYLVVMFVAVIMDLGFIGGGERIRRRG